VITDRTVLPLFKTPKPHSKIYLTHLYLRLYLYKYRGATENGTLKICVQYILFNVIKTKRQMIT